MSARKRTGFEVAGILGLSIAFMFAWTQCFAQAERADRCEHDLMAVKEAQKPPLDDDQLRRVVWETERPCGLQRWQYPFAHQPTPELCERAREYVREERARKKAVEDNHREAHFRDRMMRCSNSGAGYREGPRADSLKEPYIHDSWMLGGDCEHLAHELQKRAKNPMCVEFKDDDHESAERCRQEIEAWVTHLCSEQDLSDEVRRDCFYWTLR